MFTRTRRGAAILVLFLCSCGVHRPGLRYAGSPAPELRGSAGRARDARLTAGIWDDNANFSRFASYRDSLKEKEGAPELTAAEQTEANDAALNASGGRRLLDLALVVDTTGSMGDELSYLKAELVSISKRIAEQYPKAEQRWSVIVYRDVRDEYVVKTLPLTTDLSKVQAFISDQDAGGGGDFPEAPDQALRDAARLQWRQEDTARLVFWVADARHHEENAGAMAESYRALKSGGVKVYPVASSGIDELTEYTMRAAAQFTGGRYLFLTDDSGIGGAHKEPTIPCYQVTKLADAMIRVVGTELTGAPLKPNPASVIREVGRPVDGKCELDTGVAQLF